MATFDVLTQPWIPVRRLDGKEEELGILHVLQNAHLLTGIFDTSPLFEYGIHRLLIAFLMDALSPKNVEDIEKMLNSKQFDIELIYAYITECRKDGECFDLLDNEKPFMQAKFDIKWDDGKNIKTVAALVHDLPGGNNPVHFNHNLEPANAFLPAICAKALSAVSVFSTAGTQGPSYVNGAPPLYFLIRGKNLFETLVMSMMPAEKIYNDKKDLPTWRNNIEIEPGKKIAQVSKLFGMTLMCRRITLIPDANGGVCTQSGMNCNVIVRNAYFQKGLDYVGYDAWRDPHVAYRVTDKGRSSLKPELGKDTWRNIGYIFDNENGPDIVKQYIEVFDVSTASVIVYGLVTSQAQYEAQMRDEVSISKNIIDNEEKLPIIKLCIRFAETASFYLKKQLKKTESKSMQAETIEQAVSLFFSACRQYFFSKLCVSLAEVDLNAPGAVNSILQNWYDFVRNTAATEFERCADRLGFGAKQLLNRATAKKDLISALTKIIEGGED